jgi:nicotianamine synthase
VVNIDHDPLAISQSRVLYKKLGSKARGMEFVCEEAGYPDRVLSEFDVVYLAALVGAGQEEKERVLVDVAGKMREGSLLVVRTAHGLRNLLYPVRNPPLEFFPSFYTAG